MGCNCDHSQEEGPVDHIPDSAFTADNQWEKGWRLGLIVAVVFAAVWLYDEHRRNAFVEYLGGKLWS